MPYPTALRLQALKDLNELGYQIQQDMDGTAYITKGTSNDTDDNYQEYDELPPNVQTLVDTYMDDAETYDELPQPTN